MNRLILLLNVVVLVVNFLLALSTTDSQIGILQTTSAVATPRVRGHQRVLAQDPSVAYLRTVQLLEDFAPAPVLDGLGEPQLAAILEAVRAYYEAVSAYYEAVSAYYEAVSMGAASVEGRSGRELLQAHEALGRGARAEVERKLAAGFRDPAVVHRLATEVVRNCR